VEHCRRIERSQVRDIALAFANVPWTVPTTGGRQSAASLEPVEDQVVRELELALVDTMRYLKQGHPRGKDVIAI
jgi:hypothetical protein